MNIESEYSWITENFLFTKIFRTFRMSIQPSKLIIAFAAVCVICIAGWLMDFSRTVTTNGNAISELYIYINNPVQMNAFIEDSKTNLHRQGVFATLWDFTTLQFENTVNALFTLNMPQLKENIIDYFKALEWAFKYHYFYCLKYYLSSVKHISF